MKTSLITASLIFTVISACNDNSFSGQETSHKPAAQKPNEADSSNSNDNDSDGIAQYDPDDSASSPDPENDTSAEKKPRFALLVNDLKCGLCHVKITGDVVSTRDVPPLAPGSKAEVIGRWLAAEEWKIGTAANVSGKIEQNYRGIEMPKDINGDSTPDFPTFANKNAEKNAGGSLSGQKPGSNEQIVVKKSHKGPLAIVGDSQSPIIIEGEVFIDGDLVIAGEYKGIGTIYVSGNIYIPRDLKGQKSPFPLANEEDGKSKMAMDGLGLASQKSILIADIRKKDGVIGGIYNSRETPTSQTYEALEVGSVYSWLNKETFESLYATSKKCENNGSSKFGRSGTNSTDTFGFNRIDAYLYAKKSVAGVTQGLYAINGGVMADHFHVISSSSYCDELSQINFDFRLMNGLPLFKELAPYF